MRVKVEPYNPIWAAQFETIRRDLEQILRKADVPYLSIEHVGSTSVPGLAAKPNIDLDIVVSRANLTATLMALEQTGLYENLGEYGIPDRYVFKYLVPTDGVLVPPRSTYVCVEGTQSLRNHLALRDVCRRNSQLRDEYGRVKLELSKREWHDVQEYCEAKNEVVASILTEAGMSSEVEEIKKINSDAAKCVRNSVNSIGERI